METYVENNQYNKFPSHRGVPRSGRVFKNYKQLPYNPKLKEKAKQLRKSGNLSEVLFWQSVKNKQLLGLRFLRQKIIGNYIVDFFCPDLNLIIEIDGASHDFKNEYDEIRELFLKSLGLNIVHLTDNDLKGDFNNKLNGFYEYCKLLLSEIEHPAASQHPSKEGNQSPFSQNKI